MVAVSVSVAVAAVVVSCRLVWACCVGGLEFFDQKAQALKLAILMKALNSLDSQPCLLVA